MEALNNRIFDSYFPFFNETPVPLSNQPSENGCATVLLTMIREGSPLPENLSIVMPELTPEWLLTFRSEKGWNLLHEAMYANNREAAKVLIAKSPQLMYQRTEANLMEGANLLPAEVASNEDLILDCAKQASLYESVTEVENAKEFISLKPAKQLEVKETIAILKFICHLKNQEVAWRYIENHPWNKNEHRFASLFSQEQSVPDWVFALIFKVCYDQQQYAIADIILHLLYHNCSLNVINDPLAWGCDEQLFCNNHKRYFKSIIEILYLIDIVFTRDLALIWTLPYLDNIEFAKRVFSRCKGCKLNEMAGANFNKFLKATVMANNEEVLDAYLEAGLPVFGKFFNALAELASCKLAQNVLKKLYRHIPLASIDFSDFKVMRTVIDCSNNQTEKIPDELSVILKLACESAYPDRKSDNAALKWTTSDENLKNVALFINELPIPDDVYRYHGDELWCRFIIDLLRIDDTSFLVEMKKVSWFNTSLTTTYHGMHVDVSKLGKSRKLILFHYARHLPLILRRFAHLLGIDDAQRSKNHELFSTTLETRGTKRDYRSVEDLLKSYDELKTLGMVTDLGKGLDDTYKKLLSVLLPQLVPPPYEAEEDAKASSILDLFFPHLKNFTIETVPPAYDIRRRWPIFYYKLLTLQLQYCGSISPYERANFDYPYPEPYNEMRSVSEIILKLEVEKGFDHITKLLESSKEQFLEIGLHAEESATGKRKRSEEKRKFQTTGTFPVIISWDLTNKTLQIGEQASSKHYSLMGFLNGVARHSEDAFFKRLQRELIVSPNYEVTARNFATELHVLRISEKVVSIYHYTIEGKMIVQDYSWNSDNDSQLILNRFQEIKSQAEQAEKEVYESFEQFAQAVAHVGQDTLIKIERSHKKIGLMKDGVVFRTLTCKFSRGTKEIHYRSKERDLDLQNTLHGYTINEFIGKLETFEKRRRQYLQDVKTAANRGITLFRPKPVGSASTMLRNLAMLPMEQVTLVYPFPNNLNMCFPYTGRILPPTDFEGSLENLTLLNEMEQCSLRKLQLHHPRLIKAVEPPPCKINRDHTKEAPVDWARVLIDVLQRHGHTDAMLPTQTLFSSIKNGNLPAYNKQVHESDYKIITCQLSWIVFHLLSKLNTEGEEAKAAHERLLQVAKEMHRIADLCGQQVFTMVSMQYIITFNLDSPQVVSTKDQVLNEVYCGAALDMIDTFKILAQDPRARAQEIHLRKHLFQAITTKGFPLPVDPFTQNAGTNKDELAESYGRMDYPTSLITDLIPMILIPQFIKRMKEWQDAAIREKRFDDVHLLVESLYEILENDAATTLNSEEIEKLQNEIQETRKTLRFHSHEKLENRFWPLELIKERFEELAAEHKSIHATLLALEKEKTCSDLMELDEPMRSAQKLMEATKDRLNFQLGKVNRSVLFQKMALKKLTEEHSDKVQRSIMASDQVEATKNRIAALTDTLRKKMRTAISDRPETQKYFIIDPTSQSPALSIAGIIKLLVGNQFLNER